MPAELMRMALRPLYGNSPSVHPGLLIQRGLQRHDPEDSDLKKAHIRRVCETKVKDHYRNAYARWVAATADQMRFRSLIATVDGRLFIGLTGGGALETGCAVSHSYGVPYLPGSSLKGVTQHHVRDTVFGQAHADICDEIFGAGPADAVNETPPDPGLTGVITFHDAWWVPSSAPRPHTDRPFAEEVVTTHHPGYYQHEGEVAASDFDSPIPNAQIAVHGSFLLTLEGDPAWTELAEQMLVAALAESGIGAKTRAGYGYLDANTHALVAMTKTQDQLIDARAARIQSQRQERAEDIKRRARKELPVRQRVLEETREAIARNLDSGSSGSRREAILEELNRLTATAASWRDAADRNAAADLIEQTYERIGWADPGRKSEQRKKQQEKRKQKVALLRAGEQL